MNKVILIGRLTKDPEVRVTPNNISVCAFTVAVDRRFAKNDAQQTADFISCVAWRQQAEFLGKYFQKGSKVVITGSLQTRTYSGQDNVKRYITEVIVDELEFGESKKNNSSPMPYDDIPAPVEPQASSQGNSERGEYYELDESGLPF